MGPKCNHKCYKRKTEGDLHIERASDDEHRDWSDFL